MKSLKWVGSSKKDLIKFPDVVKQSMGFALHLAQKGEKHIHTKLLKHIGVMEIVNLIKKRLEEVRVLNKKVEK